MKKEKEFGMIYFDNGNIENKLEEVEISKLETKEEFVRVLFNCMFFAKDIIISKYEKFIYQDDEKIIMLTYKELIENLKII